jgi:hypothetical protein
MLVIALAHLFYYGRNLPLEEDWQMVAAVTGKQQNMVKWLWQLNNEHRIPLPKLLLLFLLKITRDFRSGMLLNILSAAFLAAFFIRVMYKLRGNKTHYSDAFFPVALLHLGHWENFYWCWQFTFILPTALTCILIIVLVQYTGFLTMRKALLVGACTVALPLSGANGILCLLPILPWIGYEAYLQSRSTEPGASRQAALLLFSSIVLSLVCVGIYFIGFYRPWNPPPPALADVAKTTLRFMALGFGPAGNVFSWSVFSLLSLVLYSSTFYILIRALLKTKGAEFRRCLAMFFFLGGCLFFALAMGWGRAPWVPTFGMPLRYVMLALPALLVYYFSWSLYGNQLLRKLIPIGLFAIMFTLVLPNAKKAFFWRDWYHQGATAVMDDIKKGITYSDFVARHQAFLLHWNKEEFPAGVQQLRDARFGAFKFIKDDVPGRSAAFITADSTLHK